MTTCKNKNKKHCLYSIGQFAKKKNEKHFLHSIGNVQKRKMKNIICIQ